MSGINEVALTVVLLEVTPGLELLERDRAILVGIDHLEDDARLAVQQRDVEPGGESGVKVKEENSQNFAVNCCTISNTRYHCRLV